jgi:ubiquinone/menaquinone biosynthesis C-methylase UbiE
MQHSEEFALYQKFLVSDQREKLISPHSYTATILKDNRDSLNVLDFGCGHGYVAMTMALLPLNGIRVYACDTDEECLDVLWGRIAQRSVKNLTAFHLPNYSQIYMPGWLPPMDYVYASFSMSALEHPDIALPQIVRQMPSGTQFHFTEWDPTRSHPLIDNHIPAARRLGVDDLKKLIAGSGLALQHVEAARQPYYTVRAIKI